ncbi:hypothetical protein [uncultured Clostridium sp.]|uniref:hypothetical protein n=1 Tax=uncultured Clostridium sp. TaxID=59620 RepID=UPI0025FA82BA|nr:hypothetical protein [uncultured Clostridium sp.]
MSDKLKKQIELDDDDNKNEIELAEVYQKSYSITAIALVVFFYMIMIIGLFQLVSLRNIFNYGTAFFFLIINMVSALAVIGFGPYYLRKLQLGYYIGLIVYTVLYAFAYLATWFFIRVTTMGGYLIINMIITFLYLAATAATFSFGARHRR